MHRKNKFPGTKLIYLLPSLPHPSGDGCRVWGKVGRAMLPSVARLLLLQQSPELIPGPALLGWPMVRQLSLAGSLIF